MVERGESSTRRATERPRAQLLAERMYRELEPKRRSMKAIARLMGLHGLWNAQKERTRVSDSPNRQLLDGKSYRRSPMKEQESSRWAAGSRPNISDMARIRLKIDARNLSDYETNEERLQPSRARVDTSGRVDPRDLLIKYVQKRDALFRFNPSSSLSTSVMKTSSSAKYAGNAIACMSERDTGECEITYPERIDGLLLEPKYRHRARISLKTPYIQSWRNKGSYYEAEFAEPASSGVRKLAREITDRIRNACDEREGGMYLRFRDIHPSRSGKSEGERRFVEKWKITHRYQDLEIIGEVFAGDNPPISCGRRKVAMGYPLRNVSLSPPISKSRRNKRLPCPPLDNESSAAAHDQEDFCLHQGLHHGPPEEGSPSLHHLIVPVSSESSKDADHASPAASIVEVPSVEDAPLSPKSFERVSAELNEAQMQLQLLKIVSPAYNEISTLITTEEDVAYPSSSWESSYMLDVLIQSGFDHFDFGTFKIMWQYSDYPLDPTLFDDLEEKYSEETTGSRPERLLLFDRINSGIFQIFQDLVDLHPWLMLKSATRQKERAKEALMSQESAHWEITERILLREMQWEDHREEIVLIGNEIEELLIDNVITEFLRE